MNPDPAVAILTRIIRLGPSSRAGLAREMQLSPASLSRIVRPLLEAGLLSDDLSGLSSSGMGRPSQLLEVPSHRFAFAGISVGSRELHGVLTDVRADVLCHLTRPLNEQTPAAIGEAITVLTSDVLAELQRWSTATPGEKSRASGDAPPASSTGAPTGLPLKLQNLTIVAKGSSSQELFAQGTGALNLPRVPIQVISTTDGLRILEQWFGVGREEEAFVLSTIDDDIHTHRVDSSHSIQSFLQPTSHHDPTAHLPLAGATGICQYGHVGCAAGALTQAAVIGRARSGRLLIGDNEHRPFNLTDLTYLAEIGDLPSRSALTEFGSNIATFATTIGRAMGVNDVVLDGECLTLFDSPWAIDAFEARMNTFSVPGLAPLRSHPRTGYSLRQARGAAAAGIATWVSNALSNGTQR